MINLTRRVFGKGALGLSAAALAGFGPARAQDLRPFTVTEPVHSIDSLPFYAAMRNGYFEEAGLDLSLVTTEGGGKHIAAVLAGDAQAYIGGPEHIAFVLAKGGEQLKAVVALSNRANAFLVARTGVEVPEGVPFVEQIRGRNVGVGTRGGTGYSIMLYLLEQAGMDPRADVTLVEIANEAGQLAAMQAGAVDMAMVTEPMITKGVQEGVWQPPFASMPKELGLFAWTTLNVPEPSSSPIRRWSRPWWTRRSRGSPSSPRTRRPRARSRARSSRRFRRPISRRCWRAPWPTACGRRTARSRRRLGTRRGPS